MSSNQKKSRGRQGFVSEFGLLACCLAAVPAAFAQYPTQSQVSKDGTAVMLEDYANPPLSSATHCGANSAAIDYKGATGPRILFARGAGKRPARRLAHFRQRSERHTLYPRHEDQKIHALSQVHGYLPEICLRQGQRHRELFPSPSIRPTRKTESFIPCTRRIRNCPGPRLRSTRSSPSLNLTGYTMTDPVNPPAGPVHLESVLIEWTDTNIRNATFEGTARELLARGI